MPKKVVMTYGRFNPPTAGHEKVIRQIMRMALDIGADARVYMSPTHDRYNPLTFEDKYLICRETFGHVIQHYQFAIPQTLRLLAAEGYQMVRFFAGSDRYEAFTGFINKYNGIEYSINDLKVVNAGLRGIGPGLESVSATLARKAARDNDFQSFLALMPDQMAVHTSRRVYELIQSYYERNPQWMFK